MNPIRRLMKGDGEGAGLSVFNLVPWPLSELFHHADNRRGPNQVVCKCSGAMNAPTEGNFKSLFAAQTL